MTRSLAAISVLISLFLLTGLSPKLGAATLTPVPSEVIKAALQPFVDQKQLGGAVALVATPDKVLAFDTVGYCQLTNQSPMRLDNYFWIASMTKTFTGVALMMLVDEGKLTLDDPVEKFIPEFKGQMITNTNAPGSPIKPSHPITIREIMSHTSGIADCKSLKIVSISLKEDADQYAKLPLLFEPGSKFMYNNAGIDTAGRIIEILSGMSYSDFLKSRILEPLGMTDTTFWPSDEQARRFARVTKRNKEKTEIVDRVLTDPLQPGVPDDLVRQMGWGQVKVFRNHYAMAAGGLYTSTADLLPFCRMLLGGGVYQGKRYLSEKAFQQFSSPQNGNAVKSPTEAYGVGCYVQIKSGPGLPSVGAFGHRGAAGTVFWMDPARKLIFILMLQGEQNDAIYAAFIKAGCQIAGVDIRGTAGGPKCPKEPPAFADIGYGTDPKQKFDIYLPPGPGPFPVLLYFHGGGWFAGDKVTGAMEPEPLLKVGCAMVSAEYRLVKDASAQGIVPPVAAVLADNRRALQYLRLHAAEWRLDPNRIVVAGGSAGGGSAIYLGSEGEQANPDSSDPVERVSTRVQGVIGMAAAPTTLDPQRIREWNPGVVWGYWCFEPDVTNYGSLPEFEKWLANRDKWMPYIRKYSSDLLLKKGAPPFFLQYGQTLPEPGTTPTSGELVHSPRWGLAFQKLAKELGVEVDVQYPGHPPEHYKNMWEFLYHQLGLPAK